MRSHRKKKEKEFQSMIFLARKISLLHFQVKVQLWGRCSENIGFSSIMKSTKPPGSTLLKNPTEFITADAESIYCRRVGWPVGFWNLTGSTRLKLLSSYHMTCVYAVCEGVHQRSNPETWSITKIIPARFVSRFRLQLLYKLETSSPFSFQEGARVGTETNFHYIDSGSGVAEIWWRHRVVFGTTRGVSQFHTLFVQRSNHGTNPYKP